jgi:paraquat-inducible protein A
MVRIFMPQSSTLAELFPLQAKIIQLVLILTAFLFVVGIYLPVMTVTKLLVVKNEFSILSGLLELSRDGEYLLFLVIFAFSILLPFLKMYVLFRLVSVNIKNKGQYSRYLALMHRYGRWSMLDVFVVAILAVAVKLGALASIQIEQGMYFFTTAVILIMVLASLVMRMERACT